MEESLAKRRENARLKWKRLYDDFGNHPAAKGEYDSRMAEIRVWLRRENEEILDLFHHRVQFRYLTDSVKAVRYFMISKGYKVDWEILPSDLLREPQGLFISHS